MVESATGVDRAAVRSLAVSGARWSVVDKWGVRLLSLVTFAVLAYLLEPAEFGIVAAAQVLIMMMQVLTDQGIGQAVIVEPEDTPEVRATAFWLALLYGVIGFAVLFAAAPLLALVLGIPETEPVLRALSVYPLIRALGSVPDALVQRSFRFKALAVRSISAGLVSNVLGVTLAVLGFGVWALVAQMLAYAVVSTVLLWVAVRFLPRLRFSRQVARRLWRFGWKVSLIEALTVVVGYGDNFVVGAVLGPVALGYYVIAFRLLKVLSEAINGVVSALALPFFARLKDDREATIAALKKATRLTLAGTTPLFCALVIVAPVVVPLVFGAQWQLSASMLQVLCLTGIVGSIFAFDRGVLLAAGRPGLELVVLGVMAVGTVGAAVIGAQISVYAVAVAVTIRTFVTLAVRLLALRAAIGIELPDYLRGWRAPVVAGIATLVTAGVVAVTLQGTPDLARLPVAAAVGLLVYPGVMWFLDRQLVRDLVGLADLRSR